MQKGTLGRLITLEVRAYDDGVAFRYIIPYSLPMQEILIENDSTQFRFGQDGASYPLFVRDAQTNYEDQFTRVPLSGIRDEALVALPFLVDQPGVGWAAVMEGNLDHFAGMYLHHLEGRAMETVLSPRQDDALLAVSSKPTLECPWKVVLIGTEPARLIESDLVSNLNPPSAISDTSWIKPGKAVHAPADAAAIKRAIDFAAASKLQYVTVASAWAAPLTGTLPPDITTPVAAVDLPGVMRYAKAKGIGIWLTAGWESIERQMEEAFAQFEKWGVAGVRIDAMQGDDQKKVDWVHRIAKTAAAHRLMLDLHGSYKPDGMDRTWPNVLTRGAVLGSEYRKLGVRANPDDDAMLPFTRMLAGPMDYEPGGFENATAADFYPREDKPFTLVTRAHQLALLVVFDSPLTTLADAPAAYAGQKELEFIAAVPTVWDQTRAVSGRVGEFVAVARRSGNEWYLGSITNWDAREVEVPLDFLGSGEWSAEIYSDAPDADVHPKHTVIEQKRVSASQKLKLTLAPGGGAAVRFVRVGG
jgi:alpha-glucosidase